MEGVKVIMVDFNTYMLAPIGAQYYSSCLSAITPLASAYLLGDPTSNAYTLANYGIFIPFRVMAPTRIGKMFCFNGATASGNIDLGIYSEDGVCLASTGGGTFQSGLNKFQIVLMNTPVRVSPGQFYYMALSIDNVTSTVFSFTGYSAILLSIIGLAGKTSAFPLPATVALTSYSRVFLPVFGFIHEEA